MRLRVNNSQDSKIRCFGGQSELYSKYHDQEWGVPVHDDKVLFEMLILEGAQAGLNWETILKKRKGYRNAFHGFDVEQVVNMTDSELERLREDKAIIRNRLKIFSVRNNAKIFIEIQKEFGSFDKYLWSFVDYKQINNYIENKETIPTSSKESDALSKDLKKRGMLFVGSTIIYAYMQAVGLVDDHLVSCWRFKI